MRYHALYHSGELLSRVREAYGRLAGCDLCPHRCGVNRLRGEQGLCRSGFRPRVASSNLHRGEEPPISGTMGSGTIFFSNCSLSCVFCQNFPISQSGSGETLSTRELAERMLSLQRRGAHNLNLVTPTHWLPQVLAALWLAIPAGFCLPIVWNSSGYETVEALRLLDGVVDIYLPDMKYADNGEAVRLSQAPLYAEANRSAVREMFRQVGHLAVDQDGIALRGLIIRHLVLPQGRAGSATTLSWISHNLGEETHVALMSQYFPAHRAADLPGIDRQLTHREYDSALEALEAAGLENGWVQELARDRRPV